MSAPVTIAVIAGEASGDFLGARLMAALKAQNPEVRFTGVGGSQMHAEGLQSLFPYEELAVMGIAEILPRLPSLLGRIAQTSAHIIKTRPKAVVFIDSPDFCFRVAKKVRAVMGNDAPKLIHYVAPTVWAWREGRAAKIARFLDGLICLFDFEPPYFESHGLKSVAVGHPMVEGSANTADGAVFRAAHGIDGAASVAGVLFGSRHGELKRTGPVLRDALIQMAAKMTNPPHVVAPTLPHLYPQVMEMLKAYPGPVQITTDPQVKWSAFAAMDIALAVSGTVGLELAYMKVPHVIAYKMAPLTAAMVRRLVKVKYAHLANIMADASIIPEFIQEHCTADAVAAAVSSLYLDSTSQIAALSDIGHRLGAGQTKTPSEKAANFVLSLL